ncbi:ABC-2 type transporter [Natrinema pellirubrum DSM 15624]|uniref:ABC-2 type transporter n=1 Tax=Natrinema pellirubrum (strain DSM 15624 / CIP 106293 / JCM 10476 / NCIMB 786 / 157) TaxID=797303 RepID=L0JPZ7_NATP1|nr:ABC transporter permease subunit [Natrinema pellirubrum]AGB33610.1 ABC-type transport system involved in multi-copper enzyme maturation, permease component [Natrinema pellirubrum DSM 15624]ELY70467.1 ABC-2 type transporter [Natrinema pellirubrum DSM 15624]
MSAITVAKKDFRDAVRSRLLLGLTALFALFTVGGAALASWASGLFSEGGGESTIGLIFALQTPAGFLVPVIALIVGYGAIAGERETGSLKFLLGLPHRRRDVVLGKVLGRTGVVAVSILIGFAVGLIGLVAFVGEVSPVDYLAFTLVTVAFGFVYVCLGVGISAMTRSTTKAAVGAIALVVLFKALWGLLSQVLLYAIEGTFLPETFPGWYLVFNSITPDAAYGSAIGFVLRESQFTSAGAYESQGLIESVPLVAEPWFGFVILAVWALLPLALGLWGFGRADL